MGTGARTDTTVCGVLQQVKGTRRCHWTRRPLRCLQTCPRTGTLMSGTCLSSSAAACHALPRNSRVGALLSTQQCKPGCCGRLPAQLALTAGVGLMERQRATGVGLICGQGLNLTDRSTTPPPSQGGHRRLLQSSKYRAAGLQEGATLGGGRQADVDAERQPCRAYLPPSAGRRCTAARRCLLPRRFGCTSAHCIHAALTLSVLPQCVLVPVA